MARRRPGGPRRVGSAAGAEGEWWGGAAGVLVGWACWVLGPSVAGGDGALGEPEGVVGLSGDRDRPCHRQRGCPCCGEGGWAEGVELAGEHQEWHVRVGGRGDGGVGGGDVPCCTGLAVRAVGEHRVVDGVTPDGRVQRVVIDERGLIAAKGGEVRAEAEPVLTDQNGRYPAQKRGSWAIVARSQGVASPAAAAVMVAGSWPALVGPSPPRAKRAARSSLGASTTTSMVSPDAISKVSRSGVSPHMVECLLPGSVQVGERVVADGVGSAGGEQFGQGGAGAVDAAGEVVDVREPR